MVCADAACMPPHRPSLEAYTLIARQISRVYGYMRNKAIRLASMLAALVESVPCVLLNTDESVASHDEIGRCEPPAPSGQHDSPEHDDMVVKVDGAARSVNGSSWRQARCEVLRPVMPRKPLREPNR
jgi:uncharacterized Rossmann fold enzyme